MWVYGMEESEFSRIDHDVRERSEYINSPASDIHDGASEVRENLEPDSPLGRNHAIYDEMRAKGLTDYVGWPLVGSHAGELFLAGATRRGSGTTVRAAIMICDLRDFTGVSDNWPRDDVIRLLNDYFDAKPEPLARHGGEI